MSSRTSPLTHKLTLSTRFCLLVITLYVYCLTFLDVYKVLDDILGQGAHTIVKSCVKLATNQEYAVKVRRSLKDKDMKTNLPWLWQCKYFDSLSCGVGYQYP